MQLSHRKMECAQLIILLYYWQNQNQDVEAYVLPSYFMFFMILVRLIVPSM